MKNEHFWMASCGAVVCWGKRRLSEGSEEGGRSGGLNNNLLNFNTQKLDYKNTPHPYQSPPPTAEPLLLRAPCARILSEDRTRIAGTRGLAAASDDEVATDAEERGVEEGAKKLGIRPAAS